MDREKLRDLISVMDTLPTLPAIYARVVALMENPQASAKDVGAVIDVDPVLTMLLLHSVDWRRPIFADKVPTASTAIRGMGFEALRRLIRDQKSFDGNAVRTGPLHLDDLWLHSISTAIAARAVGHYVGHADPDECYTAGLLHDIGKLVMHVLLPDRLREHVNEVALAENTFYACEVESGLPSHAVIGRILLEHLSLPPKLIEAVGLHHTPNLSERHQKLVAITHLADILSRALGHGSGGDPYVPSPKPASLSVISIRGGQIEEIMSGIERDVYRVAPLIQ